MSTLFQPKPVTLKGKIVTLTPLRTDHAADLFKASQSETIWRYMPIPMPPTKTNAIQMIETALSDQQTGSQIPFAIIHNQDQCAIGSTRYLDIQPENRALEIGWTWLSLAYQRTDVNTECKYLLLRHAFETLNAIRVQLKTDGRNTQSQNAIARIGAKKEGVLRKNRLMWDGYYRDSVYYSILDSEWENIKQNLLGMMNKVVR